MSRIGIAHLAAFGGLAAVVAWGAPAWAAEGEYPVAVLTIQTLDAFEQADAFTGALKTAVEDAEGWTYAQLEKDHALLFLTSSLDCTDPPDAACEQKIGDELKVDRFVWGTLTKDGNDVAGELHLWVRGQGASRGAKYRFPVNVVVPGDRAFTDLVLAKFLEVAGPAPPAKVKIRAGSVDGSVRVGGKEVGKIVAGSATIELPPGTHKITVVADGYEEMSTSIEVKALEQREVSLTPVKQSGGPDVQKILGIASIGVGVVAAGVATYAGVRVMQINDDLAPFRQGTDGDYFFPNDTDGCATSGAEYPNIVGQPTRTDQGDRLDYVKDLCSEGKTMQTLTLAMWPVAGAFAGTGIILLATAKWGEGQEVARLPYLVVPNFGPQGGDVTFSMRW